MSATLSKSEVNFLALEKSAHVGGVWRSQANAYSRVNSSEPSYRLPVISAGNTNHSYQSEILADVVRTIEEFGFGDRVRLLTFVSAVQRSRGAHKLTGNTGAPPQPFTVSTGLVVLCTNRRLGRPRRMDLPGESNFDGVVRRGLNDDVESVQFKLKHVVVVGMGAFAIENMRTSLEQGSAHVELLCRQRGTVCPQVVDWINFIRPFDEHSKHDPAGDAVVFEHWQQAYDRCGAPRPESWKGGLLKPDGHTVSVSDLFFVAHHMRMAGTRLGQIERLTAGGMVTRDDLFVTAEVVIKCVGFQINEGNELILGRACTRGNFLVDGYLWVIVDPHLDSGAFNSPFGSSYVNAVTFSSSLVMRYWRDTRLETKVRRTVQPTARINLLTASEGLQSNQSAMLVDPSLFALLERHLEEVASAFHAKYTPAEYWSENQRLWYGHFDLLHRTCPDEHFPQTPSYPYPFSDLLSLVAPEAPAQPVPAPIGRVTESSHRAAVSLDKVADIVRQIADQPGLDADSPLLDAGIDSLGASELRAQLQSMVGDTFQIPPSLLFEAPTIRRLAAHLSSSGPHHADSSEACPSLSIKHAVLHFDIRGGTMIVLHEGMADEHSQPLVVTQSPWGNVDHYERLAARIPSVVLGLEHAHLSTGDANCFAAVTLEDAAENAAAFISRACLSAGYEAVHLLGGSFGALLAQKIGVAAQFRLDVQPRWMIMIDPPPAGPATKAFNLPSLLVAAQMIRLGREVAGLETDAEELKRLLGHPDSEWFAAMEAASAEQDAAIDVAQDWYLAAEVAEHLAAMGQLQPRAEGIRFTKRRMDVYRNTIRLWRRQSIVPSWYSSRHDESIVLVTSTQRRDFYTSVHGENYFENIELYGDVIREVSFRGGHTAVLQACATNRNAELTVALREVIGDPRLAR